VLVIRSKRPADARFMQSKRARDLRQRASVQMVRCQHISVLDESSARASSVSRFQPGIRSDHRWRIRSDKLRTLIFLFVETDDALLLAITIDELLPITVRKPASSEPRAV